MAVHGVSRSTRDLDLLTLAESCLATEFWNELRTPGIEAQVRRGDADDPLAGVVRLTRAGEHPLDIVIGKSPWQTGIFDRVHETHIEDVSVPVVSRVDLILLKLFAGGPQDLWDVEQLLTGPDRAALSAEVERSLTALPASCREGWARVRGNAGTC